MKEPIKVTFRLDWIITLLVVAWWVLLLLHGRYTEVALGATLYALLTWLIHDEWQTRVQTWRLRRQLRRHS